MYKISVPISTRTITEENISDYITSAKKSGVHRVFLCGFGDISNLQSPLYTEYEKLKKFVATFKKDFEVGVWISAFGHGAPLLHQNVSRTDAFQQMVGIKGEVGTHANCPSDESFTKAYCEAIKKIASMNPDLIMLDDDFRINWRGCYYMGCFCPNHLQEYYKRIGEEIPREKLEELIFTGGKNKYRSEYRKLMGETLLGFAKALRTSIDSVNPTIRLSACTTPDNWDNSGTDMIELSKVFAGNTKPFTRIFGAPYHDTNIIPAIEVARMQFNWLAGSGIEAFAEGDVYPRPRYNVPSKLLELFEFALLADGTGNGILNYVYDYSQKPDYEMGYIERYNKNAPIREKIRELFENKSPVGLSVFNVIHKVENQQFPDNLLDVTVRRLLNLVSSPSRYLISPNSISTTYTKGDYPVLLMGENARYITKDDLKNGAILDASAAKILSESGIDTGLISASPCAFDGEYFVKKCDTIKNIDNSGLMKIQCKENAEILSIFTPGNSPASYLYKNAEGMKFYVLAYDIYYEAENYNKNYSNNYYRQEQIIESIEWLCDRKLPVTCIQNPNLYILTSKNGNSMSVMLINVNLDDVIHPEIKLDQEYSEIKFGNCTGTLKGDRVYLSDITPYGLAMFEVK